MNSFRSSRARVWLAALVVILAASERAAAEPWSALEVAAMLQRRLSLSPRQMKDLRPVVNAYARSVSGAIESRRGHGVEGWSALLDDLDSYYVELESGVASVLTPAQLAELEEVKAEVRTEVSAHLEERAFSGLAERIHLSEAERERVLAVYQEDWRRKRELVEKYRGQKGRSVSREVGRELKAIHEDTERELQTLLTPEQLNDYRDYREEQRKKILENLKKRQKQK